MQSSAEWDSSFNQILNRTKNNLNRINQRYAPSLSDNILLSNSFNNENININNNLKSYNSSNNSREKKDFTHISEPKSYSNYQQNENNLTLLKVHERLARLEENQEELTEKKNQRIKVCK